MYPSRFDVHGLMGLEYRAWVFLRLNIFFLFLGEFEGVFFSFLCSCVVGGWGVPEKAAPDQPLGVG
jgi:hypothetical protein